MPTCPTPMRRASFVAALALFACIAAPLTAQAATIDQGSLGGAQRCSDDAVQVDTTCVLPFGGAAERPSVVTRIAVGDPTPDVRVATPISETPGRWRLVQVAKLSSRWKPQGTAIDTAIALKPGQILVLVDPLVTTTQAELDFDPTELPGGGFTLAEVTQGLRVGARPVGRIELEPDADDDGWGDESQDLCRGVAGGVCGAATVKTAVAGPAYVPSNQPISFTWSVTNASPTPQPLVVNLVSNEQTPEFTAPAGANCAPGNAGSTAGAWGMVALSQVLPSSSDSIYASAPPSAPGAGVVNTSTPGRWYCVLPVMEPGATVSGTVGGRGGVKSGDLVAQVRALAPLQSTASRASSTLTADAKATHRVAGPVPNDWKPYEILPGKIAKHGKWPVSARCGGPAGAPSCSISGIVKAPIGGKVLGKAKATSAKPGAAASLAVVLSKSGIKWLATHRKSSVDLVLTAQWPGESSITTTERFQPSVSSAFKRQLGKLAPKKAKKKG